MLTCLCNCTASCTSRNLSEREGRGYVRKDNAMSQRCRRVKQLRLKVRAQLSCTRIGGLGSFLVECLLREFQIAQGEH